MFLFGAPLPPHAEFGYIVPRTKKTRIGRVQQLDLVLGNMLTIKAWLLSLLMPKLVALGFTPATSKPAVKALPARTGSKVLL